MNNEEIKKLQQENEELKALIKEGKVIFNNISEIINIKQIAKNNMMMARIPFLIRKIQDNPNMMDEILNFVNKLNRYENA